MSFQFSINKKIQLKDLPVSVLRYNLANMLEVNIYSLLLLLTFFALSLSQPYYDYCVVGAGPGGIQMAYFLQKNNRNYIVLEKGCYAVFVDCLRGYFTPFR